MTSVVDYHYFIKLGILSAKSDELEKNYRLIIMMLKKLKLPKNVE